MAEAISAGTVLITGTTSGVGLNAAKALTDRGWTVVTANRDPVRAAQAAESLGIPSAMLHHLRMDMGDLESVRTGVETLVGSLAMPLDARERAHKPSPRSQDFVWMSVATWRQKHEAHVARAAQGAG